MANVQRESLPATTAGAALRLETSSAITKDGLTLPNQLSESLANDLLRGAKAIADFVGLDERDAFYRLQSGFIPAKKEGAQWVASKSALKAFYGVPPSNAAPPPTTVNADTTIVTQRERGRERNTSSKRRGRRNA